MTLVLLANIVLSAAVLAVVLGIATWAVIRSHHEGRPVVAASGRRWMRHTISLRGARTVRPLARPFAS